MSKSSKLRNKEKNRKQKAAAKAARQAQYDAWRAAGQNSKSKRSRRQNQMSKGIKQRNHSQGFCGNIGCKSCNPAIYNLMTPRQLGAI